MYQLEMQVRDYECDMQGIVNNSVYMNYLEHARHEFLKMKGIDFAALATQGINLVVIRAEVDYLKSLQSSDSFKVAVNWSLSSRLKVCFEQSIINQNNENIMRAKIYATALNTKGRPKIPEEIAKAINNDS
ncbi:acyl-CoA thioesterase [Catenovulum maritimum]|uniref:4-hydroxybenzoyl-CoA thioesterase n=1 Tax=Catenovulum maritimum TaxID=1513271 RepID=A0A0J8GUJ0_9ALTE|nr:acyl-CoA thioesterase [Catenovulum maritimum]KMT66445.1 hypothetical protein XM47_02560 [Catenovulum maritimum]